LRLSVGFKNLIKVRFYSFFILGFQSPDLIGRGGKLGRNNIPRGLSLGDKIGGNECKFSSVFVSWLLVSTPI
jgi:hypothetical protein